MNPKTRTVAVLLATCVAPALRAQFSFDVGGRTAQIHSFASQGFALTGNNNYLTMQTSKGAFFWDGGANISTRLTDKFRVGAQVYFRDIGQLGNAKPMLYYAMGDYKFTDWFGVRAGKVKTALGLLNELQDMDFLHTWAILPQSVYPLDLCSRNLAHTGVDIYGNIGLAGAGRLGYTVFAGTRPADKQDGYYYASAGMGYPITSYRGKIAGVDLRWTTPVDGLMLGGSFAPMVDRTRERDLVTFDVETTSQWNSTKKWTAAWYADYSRGPWRFSGEYRRNFENDELVQPHFTMPFAVSERAWFASAAYRINKRLEIGTYHTRFYVSHPTIPDPSTDHIFDQTVSARFDVTRFWSLKVEGHFMDGTGDVWSSHGFYLNDNATLKPKTTLFVLRSGFSF